ncbi:MAG: nucleotidyltransferase family protein [Anaerolineae bacterium]|nr:nucleotidyltransferase family protein [Gemmatimonadaceae bacterium]
MTLAMADPFACIVLAAGAGTRFGEPKAEALLASGERFLDAIVKTAADAGAHPIVAVVSERIQVPLPAKAVRNRDAKGEQIVSVRLGLMQLAGTLARGALVWPVDHPFVALRSVHAIVEAYRRTRAHIVLPTCDGRRGHPAFFDRAVWDELMTVESGGAQSVVRAFRDRVHEVPTDDPGILQDIDTRSDMPPGGWRTTDAIS